MLARCDARVDSKMIEVLDPIGFAGPRGVVGTAKVTEAPLESDRIDSAQGVSRRNNAARTRIDTFEVQVADGETDGVCFMHVEEPILPERVNPVDFQRSAKAPSQFFQIDSRKPFGHGSQRRRGDDNRAVAEGVVGNALGCVAHGNSLPEILAKPLPCRCAVARKGECLGCIFSPIAGGRQGDRTNIRRKCRANPMNRGRPLAVDAITIRRVERPDAIQFQTASRPDAALGHGHRIKGFDGMEADLGETRTEPVSTQCDCARAYGNFGQVRHSSQHA